MTRMSPILFNKSALPPKGRDPGYGLSSKSRWHISDLLARARNAELDLVEAKVIEPELKQELYLWARLRWYRLDGRRRAERGLTARARQV